MTPTTSAQKQGALAERPKCETCGVYLDLRDGFDGKSGNGWTPEQRWCGVWYDHPATQPSLIGHTSSVLLPSRALLAARAA